MSREERKFARPARKDKRKRVPRVRSNRSPRPRWLGNAEPLAAPAPGGAEPFEVQKQFRAMAGTTRRMARNGCATRLTKGGLQKDDLTRPRRRALGAGAAARVGINAVNGLADCTLLQTAIKWRTMLGAGLFGHPRDF
jgi:hypothetical protein